MSSSPRAPGADGSPASASTDQPEIPTDATRVFVVHGRNLGARDAMFTFLRSLGLHPLEWPGAVAATGKSSPYIGEILDGAFNVAQAVVVLFTPDDEARLRKSLLTEMTLPMSLN